MAGITVADIELHVEERGDGDPLLLIAGIPAVANDWAPLAERLAATRRTIAYDNRGSGASTDDDQIIPAASSAILHERIPGSRLEIVAGTGHLFFLEQPERTVALIEGFLA